MMNEVKYMAFNFAPAYEYAKSNLSKYSDECLRDFLSKVNPLALGLFDNFLNKEIHRPHKHVALHALMLEELDVVRKNVAQTDEDINAEQILLFEFCQKNGWKPLNRPGYTEPGAFLPPIVFVNQVVTGWPIKKVLALPEMPVSDWTLIWKSLCDQASLIRGFAFCVDLLARIELPNYPDHAGTLPPPRYTTAQAEEMFISALDQEVAAQEQKDVAKAIDTVARALGAVLQRAELDDILRERGIDPADPEINKRLEKYDPTPERARDFCGFIKGIPLDPVWRDLNATLQQKDEEIKKETVRADHQTVRGDTAERMHKTLAKEIKPLLREGLRLMVIKAWEHWKPKKGHKKADADDETILSEEQIYHHFEEDRWDDGNLSFKQFVKDTFGDYGLTEEQMNKLSDNAQYRRKSGQLAAAQSRCRGKK